MTDTSIVKPLVWCGTENKSTAIGPNYNYSIFITNQGAVFVSNMAGKPRFADVAAAKAACQADYESCILSAIDLTAHDAAVRAEVLEHVADLLAAATAYVKAPEFQSSPDKHKLKQKIAELMVCFVSDIRSLKGEG